MNRSLPLPLPLPVQQELQELRLTGCSIQQLPPSLRNLTSLRTLVLSANQLEGLPAEVAALTSLECLDCSLNHIAHVDRLPPALRRLNLQVRAGLCVGKQGCQGASRAVRGQVGLPRDQQGCAVVRVHANEAVQTLVNAALLVGCL